MTGRDGADLQRFIDAQWPLYDRVLCELRAGQKRTHWMWFIFPQIAGLGHSAMSQRYALSGLDEARAYLAHPLLGARLRECVAALNAHAGRRAADMLGAVDALKLHSCLTLFLQAAPGSAPFQDALETFFGGAPDTATLRLLAAPATR